MLRCIHDELLKIFDDDLCSILFHFILMIEANSEALFRTIFESSPELCNGKRVGDKRDFDDAEEYLLACNRYIELNPVSADMVMHPAESRWRSYRSDAHEESCALIPPHETERTAIPGSRRMRLYACSGPN